MRKKVLYFITKSNWGGAQRYVYDLSTNLPRDYESVVILGGHGALVQKLRARGVRTITIDSLERDVGFLKEWRSFFAFISILRRERPDVVHLNSSKAAGLGALAARICGIKKIIFTVHGWPFLEPRFFLARFLIYLASWFSAFLSHVVITVSKADQRYAQNMWGIGSKTVYIPLGIPELHFFDRDHARHLLSIKPGTNAILTIAELTANKGLVHGIDAVSFLNTESPGTYEYIIIGEGEDRNKLEEHARRAKAPVRFLGFRENAYELLRACDVFLLPSLKEGTPYVLLEALQAGVPIVASCVGGIPDLLPNGANGSLVTPRDSAGIAQAVRTTQIQQTRLTGTLGLPQMLEKTMSVYAQ